MEVPPSDVRKKLDSLTDEEWAALYNKLGYYTKNRFGRFPELDLEGLVQDAIEDAYTGVRNWPEGYTLEKFLIGTINSKVSHHREKETIEVPGEEASDEGEAAKPKRIRRRQPVEDIDSLSLQAAYSRQPADEQRRVECKEMIDRISKLVSSNQIFVKMIELRAQGMTVQEIGENLGLSRAEMYNLQKRLERKLKELRRE